MHMLCWFRIEGVLFLSETFPGIRTCVFIQQQHNGKREPLLFSVASHQLWEVVCCETENLGLQDGAWIPAQASALISFVSLS